MKAFVLAAGVGNRLHPLTEQVSKCLVPIAGRPLLAYWLDHLWSHEVDTILMNTHHLHEQVFDFFEQITTPIHVTLTYEPRLLGSAGTLLANRPFIDDGEDFFVIYADNLTNADLTRLLTIHKHMSQPVTIGLFRTKVPENCGILVLDDRGIVVNFQEKPRYSQSNLAFAGIMVASAKIFDHIPSRIPCDLATDVLPNLATQMAGCELNAYLRDIGTLESYNQAQVDVATLKLWG